MNRRQIVSRETRIFRRVLFIWALVLGIGHADWVPGEIRHATAPPLAPRLVGFGDGHFLGVFPDWYVALSLVARSIDGKQWEFSSLPPMVFSQRAPVYGDGRWVMAARRALEGPGNGGPGRSELLRCASNHAGGWVALSESAVLVSDDLTSWSLRWSAATPENASSRLLSIAQDPASGRWVAAGSRWSDAAGREVGLAITSTDLNAWTMETFEDDLRFTGVAVGNRRWCLVGDNSPATTGALPTSPTNSTWSTSSDGLSWTRETPAPLAIIPGSATFLDGQWVVTARLRGTDPGSRSSIYTSPDGVTWTDRLPDGPRYGPTRVITTESGCLAMGWTGGTVQPDGQIPVDFWASPDGINWTRDPRGPASLYGVADLAFGDVAWIGVGGAIIHLAHRCGGQRTDQPDRRHRRELLCDRLALNSTVSPCPP